MKNYNLKQLIQILIEDLHSKYIKYPVVPLKVEYTLTEYGETLIIILESLVKWGTSYVNSIGFDNIKKGLLHFLIAHIKSAEKNFFFSALFF